MVTRVNRRQIRRQRKRASKARRRLLVPKQDKVDAIATSNKRKMICDQAQVQKDSEICIRNGNAVTLGHLLLHV